MEPFEDKGFYSLEEIAQATGKSYSSLIRWRVLGYLPEPGLKIGQRRFYSPEQAKEVAALVENRKPYLRKKKGDN